MARTEDAQQRELYVRGVKTEVAIARTRAEVATLSADLAKDGLLGWGGGTVSARVPGADLFVIKPPAGEHDDLAPENMIVCDLDGDAVEGTPGSERLPSGDVAAHSRVYRTFPAVHGVVRSQSPHVLARAAAGRGIPCFVVSMAERFGGGVPVVTAPLDDPDAVATDVAVALTSGPAPAVLVAGDGAYVTGTSARDAAKAAALVEELARVADLAPDDLDPLPQPLVDRLHAAHRRRSTQTTDDRR